MAAHKYPPTWVPLVDLWKALATPTLTQERIGLRHHSLMLNDDPGERRGSSCTRCGQREITTCTIEAINDDEDLITSIELTAHTGGSRAAEVIVAREYFTIRCAGTPHFKGQPAVRRTKDPHTRFRCRAYDGSGSQ